jgi:predicted transcriptional regulator
MRGFGELESMIMSRVWAADHSLAVRDVLEDLRSEHDVAYTTVMTVMDNLYRKGWLTRERDGRAYLYSAVASREEYSADLMREALTNSTDAATTLAHFMGQLSPDESDHLRKALRRASRKRA